MGTNDPRADGRVRHLDMWLERDEFACKLLRHLAGTLEEVVGLDEATGYIAVVGQRVADEVNDLYRSALGVDRLTREQMAEVLVDMKRRVGGDFYVIEETEQRLVLGNRVCPFGAEVLGRPSLCMLTSSVFGSIVAQNLGYARVVVEEAIAMGNPACRIVVDLVPPAAGEEPEGREYFEGER